MVCVKPLEFTLHTKIAVVVVAGVGMVTSLPPAAPARTEPMPIWCSYAPCQGAHMGFLTAIPAPGMSPAWDQGYQPAKSPSCHSHFRMNAQLPRAELWEGQEWALGEVRALPSSTSELLCQEKLQMSAKGAELPSPSCQLCTTLSMKCKQHGRKAKGPKQIRLPAPLFITCLSLLPGAREERKAAVENQGKTSLWSACEEKDQEAAANIKGVSSCYQGWASSALYQ